MSAARATHSAVIVNAGTYNHRALYGALNVAGWSEATSGVDVTEESDFTMLNPTARCIAI